MFDELIQNKLGIKDLDTYSKYKQEAAQRILSKEEIEQLSPDKISSKEFWKWIDGNKELRKDAISFGATNEMPIEQINKSARFIQHNTGMNIYLETMLKFGLAPRVLEIGPGFGALKEDMEKIHVPYLGVDVYPKIEGILEVEDGDTLFPETIRDQKFDIVYSSNVFQHLTLRQKISYYRQIQKILAPNGVFSFNSLYREQNGAGLQGFKSPEKFYVCHYGQFVELQTPKEYLEELKTHFEILFCATRFREQFITFHCVNKFSASSEGHL